MRRPDLERQWDDLMSLCRKEEELAAGDHPKLLRLIGKEIDRLATDMGFTPRQIVERHFRAERQDGRIVRVLSDF
jgi:hypothetical protein